MQPGRPDIHEVQTSFLTYLHHRYPGRRDLRLAGWERLSNGWECDVHGFTLTYLKDAMLHTRNLVLRIYEGMDSTLFPGRFVSEYVVMKRLHGDGFPVPAVHLFESDPSHLGAPFMLMDRVQGEMMYQVVRRLPDPDREQLFMEYCALLAALHRLDPLAYALDLGIDVEDDPVEAQLGILDRVTSAAALRGTGPPMDWLRNRSRTVTRAEPSVVHWDYHPSNVLVSDDGRLFVIDWTGATVTDYRFDIASSLIFLPDDATRDRFGAAYGQASGRDMGDMDFFGAAVCFRRLALISAVIAGGSEMLGLRPGLARAIAPHIGEHVQGLNDRLEALTGHRVPVPL